VPSTTRPSVTLTLLEPARQREPRLWTVIRQPQPRELPTASQSRSPDWPSRVSEANHVVTRSALDGQTGDRTIKQAGGRGGRLARKDGS
jgi:hypothetical protein